MDFLVRRSMLADSGKLPKRNPLRFLEFGESGAESFCPHRIEADNELLIVLEVFDAHHDTGTKLRMGDARPRPQSGCLVLFLVLEVLRRDLRVRIGGITSRRVSAPRVRIGPVLPLTAIEQTKLAAGKSCSMRSCGISSMNRDGSVD